MMSPRRGFYFSMDVLLFLFIISFGVVLVLAALPGKLPRTQPLVLADSVSAFLATTTTREVFASASCLRDLREAGSPLVSPDYTLLEQATLFVEQDPSNGPAHAKDYLDCVLSSMDVIPKTYGIRIGVSGFVGGGMVDYQSPGRALQSEADTLVVSKRIVFFYDRQNHKTVGPYRAEVIVW